MPPRREVVASSPELSEPVASSSAVSTSDSDNDEPPSPKPAPLSPPPPRRSPRTKTAFHLAQPPPSAHHMHRHRHAFRPSRALIVQIQKLSHSARPLPALDVLPAAVFGSKLKKMQQGFRPGLSRQDIIFLGGEEYSRGVAALGDDGDEDDDLSSRRVVAAISQNQQTGEDGKFIKTPVIRFRVGPEWTVTPLVGGYEFVAQEYDGSTLVARWLPKVAGSRRRSNTTTSGQRGSMDDERRFQFSMYNPVTRKRPILAWMDRQNIEIYDKHPGISSLPTSPAASPPASVSSNDRHFASSHIEPDVPDISDQLRTIIIVTGIWVALKEGYVTSTYRECDPLAAMASTPTTLKPSQTSSLSSRHSTVMFQAPAQRNSLPADWTGGSKKLLRAGTLLAHQATTDRNSAEGPSVPVLKRSRSLGAGSKSHNSGTSRRSKIFSTHPPPSTSIGTEGGSAVSTPSATPASRTPEPSAPAASTPHRAPSPESSADAGCVPRALRPNRRRQSSSVPNSPRNHRRVREAANWPESAADFRKSGDPPAKRRSGFRATIHNLFRRSAS